MCSGLIFSFGKGYLRCRSPKLFLTELCSDADILSLFLKNDSRISKNLPCSFPGSQRLCENEICPLVNIELTPKVYLELKPNSYIVNYSALKG